MLPGEQRMRKPAVSTRVLLRGEALPLRHAVHVQQRPTHPDRIAGHRDQTLDQGGVRIFRLVDLIGRNEHHDITAFRLVVARQVDVGERHVRPVRQLVHEQPVPDEQGGIMLPDGIR